MNEILEKVRAASLQRLERMMIEVLSRDDDISLTGGLRDINENQDKVLSAFIDNMNGFFDELVDKPSEKPEPVYDFDSLSLVQDAELDAMVALEGMINAARNLALESFISFNTRLDSLFDDKRIDGSNDPLDPSQVGTAFKKAVRPLDLDANNALLVYRRFNERILRNLQTVLNEADKVLIDNGILPDLGMDGGKKYRPQARLSPRPPVDLDFGTVEHEGPEPAGENPEVFSMMQNLLHPAPSGGSVGTGGGGSTGGGIGTSDGAMPGGGPVPYTGAPQYAVPAPPAVGEAGQPGILQPFVPGQGQQVQMVDQGKLMDILTRIERSFDERGAADFEGAENAAEAEKLNLQSALGELLHEEEEEGVVHAIDGQSSDIINLVTLLYEAIWDDESVPIPIKELIGRTQITIIKVALSDTTFFNQEKHPARMVLNEFAEAGIGWNQVEDLKQDPLYHEIEDLVHRILSAYDGQISFFEDILKDFRAFRAKEAAKTRVLEQRIMRATERKDLLGDINELVTQKIEEQIVDRDLDEFVRQMLENQFHKFMVMLVLKEGPGTSAWKQAINTIDVLLWTVRPHEHNYDRGRLETINPRLLNNLRKAFRIAQVDPLEIEVMIERLQKIQEASFLDGTGEAGATPSDELQLVDMDADAESPPAVDQAGEQTSPEAPLRQKLAEDDPYVKQADDLNVGVWAEFTGDDEISIRCKLAARIKAIDKYIFVNRQGIKVLERTRMALAKELKEGTVKLISDGLLFSRALESVIGNLREAQMEQQTGSAYHPDNQLA